MCIEQFGLVLLKHYTTLPKTFVFNNYYSFSCVITVKSEER